MKEIICITCPNGCRMQAEMQEGTLILSGNLCPRGEGFARAELTHPTRSLTTTVRTVFPDVPVLPVRTEGEIPKERIFEAMEQLSHIVVSEKLACGDTLLDDLAGCRVICTSDILQEVTPHEKSRTAACSKL